MQVDIIVQCNELRMLREALKQQYLKIEENKQALELEIKQMAEEYEVVRKCQEKRHQYMVFILELAKQQVAEEEQDHGLAGVDLETIHKEKKTGLKERCQQHWKTVEDEKGIFKKVEKSCKIVKNELLVKCKSNGDDEKKNCKIQNSTGENENQRNEKFHGNQLNKIHKKFTKLWNDKCNYNRLNLASGAVLGAGLGAAAGAVVGGTAGVILGPCAIATAAAGAAVGAAAGGISGAIATLYARRRKRYCEFGYERKYS